MTQCSESYLVTWWSRGYKQRLGLRARSASQAQVFLDNFKAQGFVDLRVTPALPRKENQ